MNFLISMRIIKRKLNTRYSPSEVMLGISGLFGSAGMLLPYTISHGSPLDAIFRDAQSLQTDFEYVIDDTNRAVEKIEKKHGLSEK